MGQNREGIVVETNEGNVKTIVFGWGAVALGIGVAVSAILLSNYLGWALTVVGMGMGIGLASVGVGEGVKRARQGDAAKIEAKARMIEARHRDRLPPPY